MLYDYCKEGKRKIKAKKKRKRKRCHWWWWWWEKQWRDGQRNLPRVEIVCGGGGGCCSTTLFVLCYQPLRHSIIFALLLCVLNSGTLAATCHPNECEPHQQHSLWWCDCCWWAQMPLSLHQCACVCWIGIELNPCCLYLLYLYLSYYRHCCQ